MDDLLSGKTVVVIGGTSGIGFAVARAALDAGARVVVGSSQAAKVEAVAASLGAGASGHTVDVGDEGSVAGFFAAVGPFDHLAYTAGDWSASGRGDLGGLAVAEAGAIFKVRFWGAVHACKYAQPNMAAGGSITLTNGMIAHRPSKGSALSTAMAGAIEHLTEGLAVEMAPLRVNCVCPGMVRTEVWNSIPEDGREARIAEMTKRQLIPRIGEPAEVAQAYLYLMRGGYTTGQVLQVDGGMR
jgi:NAD(P)-dependent dehydrogenase (short-subunit alcohol dehydrogenase family)